MSILAIDRLSVRPSAGELLGSSAPREAPNELLSADDRELLLGAP